MHRALLAGLAIGALACGPTQRQERSIELESCRLEGLGRPALCGVLERPEDPDAPHGSVVPLRVAVVPAEDPRGHPPLYLLAGGPGQAASQAWPALLPALGAFVEQRDVVLVDQRGTGGSRPLACPQPTSLSEKLQLDYSPERIAQCLERIDAAPAHYITAVAADDLDGVRRSLGHARIDLVGGSYGTRVALVYLRRYPEHVHALVVDGLAPVDFAIPSSFAVDAERAFDRLVADCTADSSCSAAYNDVRQLLDRVLDQVKGGKTIRVSDPRSGKPTQVRIDREVVAMAVRGVLYQPTIASLLPLTLARAEQGEFSPLVAQATLFSDGLAENFAEGMFLSVVCTEDVPFIPDDDPASEATFIGSTIVRALRRACQGWPKGVLPPGYRDPVHSDVPVLLLSGDLDPVTSPRWGEHASTTLSRARHLVVPGTGHGTLHVGCVPELVNAFLAAGDGDAVDAECLEDLRRPPFFIDAAGPTH